MEGDPLLPQYEVQARNYLLACFAVSLTRGETLQKHGRIKYSTIVGYVRAVCSLHKDRNMSSPHNAPTDYITVVLNALKKYEKVKDRCKMIHDKMIHHMEKVQAKLDPDSLQVALIDWIYL